MFPPVECASSRFLRPATESISSATLSPPGVSVVKWEQRRPEGGSTFEENSLGMHCATCFQTAEEGSKYCSSCRQAREAGGAAWELPGASSLSWGNASQAPAWKPEQDAAALLASPAWSEGTSWSPPPATTAEAMPAASAVSLVELEPPRPQPHSPQPAGQSVAEVSKPEPDYLANPFGEPPDPPAVASKPAPVEAPTVPVRPEPSTSEVAAARAAIFVVTSPTGPSEQSCGDESSRGNDNPEPARPPSLESEDYSPITVFSTRPRDSGINPLLAVLVGGLFIVCLLGFGKVVKDSMDTPGPTAASSPAAGAGAGDAGQRFLLGAKSSMEARDFELAASQLRMAVQEMESAGAAESEIAAANLLLAQALLKQGKANDAKALLAELSGAEAKTLAGQVDKALRQQAEDMMAQSDASLRAGDITDGLRSARQAEKILRTAGGSPQQLKRAEKLLARAEKADASRGLPRTARPAAAQPEVVYQPELPVRRRTRGGSSGYAARPRIPQGVTAAPLPQQPSFPQAQAQQPREQVNPNSLPMAAAMRGRRRGRPAPQMPAEAPMPQAQQPSSYPEGQPQAGPPSQSPPQGEYVPEESSSGRSRRGSEGVLPGYNSGRSGGSVY